MTPPPTHSPADQGAGTSVFDLLLVLARHWKLVILVPLACALLGIISAVTTGPRYEAEARFAPTNADQGPSQVQGLAAQFGVNLDGMGGSGESLKYYAELLRSREFLLQVGQAEYRGTGGTPQPLPDLLGIEGDSASERLTATVDHLTNAVRVGIDAEANIVTLETTAPSDSLAVQLNYALLEVLEDFNRSRRRSTAAEERRFVEARLREARETLAESEEALLRFRESNRSLQETSPAFLELQRLARRVDMNQQLYVSLAQAFEEARIQEVRNTPVVNLLQRPEHAVLRLGRGLFLKTILGASIGLFLALAIIFTIESWRRHRERSPEAYRELRRIMRRGVRSTTE